MKSILAATLLLASVSYVHAKDTPSGPGRGVTCSQLASECRAYNARKGLNVGDCAGYKAACIASGTYSTPNRHITDVVRR